jgi:hypothetical protein
MSVEYIHSPFWYQLVAPSSSATRMPLSSRFVTIWSDSESDPRAYCSPSLSLVWVADWQTHHILSFESTIIFFTFIYHTEKALLCLWERVRTLLSVHTQHKHLLIMESLAGAELPSANQHIIRAFNVIQLISAGGLTLILLTALISKRVKRHSTWYNFTVSWIFSCICYTLLCFAGQQVEEPPNHMLCTIQSALIYAAPVLWVSVNMFSKILVF